MAMCLLSLLTILTAADEPVTRSGIPVHRMWFCPLPQAGQPAMGFPLVPGAEHAELYHATVETGAYSHHAQLVKHGGRFWAMWSNHPKGEDAPGQRVLYASSADGLVWTPWAELFPPPGPVGEATGTGLASAAGGWLALGDRLFARATVWDNLGFENADRTERADQPDRDHPFLVRQTYAPIARELLADGTLGPRFALGRNAAPNLDGELIAAADPQVAELVRSLQALLPRRRPPQGVDSNRLCEAVYYTAKDGRTVCLLRDDNYSHRMYFSVSDDGGQTFPTAVPTDIPDTPSLTCTVELVDGTVLLIGNQSAPAFDDADKVRHHRREPLTVAVSPDGYRFVKVMALRANAPELRIPNVRGRGPGFQYPDALVDGGMLYVLYSIGKEDVGLTRVPLAEVIGGQP